MADGFDPAEFSAFKGTQAPPAASPAAPAPAGGAGGFDPAEFAQSKPEGMSWKDVGIGAVSNAPKSAAQFASDIAQPFLHPIDTVNSFKDLGLGVMEKLGVKGGNEHEKYADAVGQFFKDRYGSVEGFKKTMATDPVGFASDLSVLLSGGGTLAGRIPGIGGTIARAAGTASRAVDPLSAVGAAATKVVGPALGGLAGMTTGAGYAPMRIAAETGAEAPIGRSLIPDRLAKPLGLDLPPGPRAFRDNITRREPLIDVVENARDAVSQMRTERGTAYRAEMAKIGQNPNVLSFNKIDRALLDAQDVATFKGQKLDPATDKMRNNVYDAVEAWRQLPPNQFHTAEGLDALKKQVGYLARDAAPGSPAKLAADTVYHAIHGTIQTGDPRYAKVMQGYEKASSLIKEMQGELSVNPKANVSTTLRKLQSTLRDNVNANFGRREELAKYLSEHGAPNLMEKLAGQSLRPMLPRGLQRVLATVTEFGAAGTEIAAHTAGHGATAAAALGTLKALPALVTTSPRLMGELAYRSGQATRVPSRAIGRAAYQAGRLEDQPLREPLRLTVHPRPYGDGSNPYQP